MLCRDAQAALPGLISDDLPDARATGVRGHLATCADCRQLLASYRQDRRSLGAFLRSADWSPAPDRRWETTPPTPRRRVNPTGWAYALAGTLALVLLTGVVTIAVYALFSGGVRGFAATTPTPACEVNFAMEPGYWIAAGYQPEEVQRLSQRFTRAYPCGDEAAAAHVRQELAAESPRLLAEGPFTQAWRQLAQQLTFPLFRPVNVPSILLPGFIQLPSFAPKDDPARAGGVAISFRSATNPSALVIIEGAPPALQEYVEGESVPVGQFFGRYREDGTTRWLVFQRDGTRIVLQGQSEITRADLFSIAVGLERVPIAPVSCPVTRPQVPAFVPPAPHGAAPPPLYGDTFWYGSEKLWTWLPADGTWRILTDKSFWWREGFEPRTEQQPDLALSGRRLDGDAPTFTDPAPATNGFRDDIGKFMLTGVDLPTPGCWEITARYGQSAELTFVIWVDPSAR